jgi:hypothetical protein
MGREFDGQMDGRMACRVKHWRILGQTRISRFTGSEAFSQGEKQHLVARTTQIRESGSCSSHFELLKLLGNLPLGIGGEEIVEIEPRMTFSFHREDYIDDNIVVGPYYVK